MMTHAVIVLGCRDVLSEETTEHPDRFILAPVLRLLHSYTELLTK